MDTFKLVVTAEDLNAIQNPCPEFLAWAWKALQDGTLNVVVLSCIKSGLASGIPDALAHLNSLTKENLFTAGRVGVVDLQGGGRRRALRRLRIALGGAETQSRWDDPARFHGTFGHSVIPELFSGRLDQLVRPRRKSIREIWRALNPGANLENAYTILLHKPRGTAKLDQLLRDIFGGYREALRRREILDDEYQIFLTCLTWLSAIRHYLDTGPRILFTEVPILPANYDFGGGRIDALEFQPGAKELSNSQKEMLLKMSQQRSQSVGHLILDLLSSFPIPADILLTDWKFAVGDGEGRIIRPDDVKQEPLPRHKKQMERYLSFAVLAYQLAERKNPTAVRWDIDFSPHGRIVYLFPQIMPIIHEVRLGPSDLERIFVEEVVWNWTAAKRNALVRAVSNLIIGRLVEALGGNGDNQNGVYRRVYTESAQTELFPNTAHTGELVGRVVDRYARKRFADPGHVIEIVGRKKSGEPRCEMHVDRLLAAIEKGEVMADGRFNSERGGFVCCPVHQEDTPSMYVQFNRGVFKCFGVGCGIGGQFASGSMPSHIQVLVTPWQGRGQRDKATGKLIIPERHGEIMAKAQAILQQAFRGSMGERYLREERFLDTNLAFEMGAGFGNEALLNGLLDSGFSYDDLIFYGFLSISPRVSSSGKVPQLLKDRGMKNADIVREIKGGVKPTKGFPYSLLDQRVTFPLVLGRVTTSFYGRSIDPLCPKNLRHRKLKNDLTNIPHGAFNMGALYSGARLILDTEGAMDVLTFVQLTGHRASLAHIGTINDVTVEAMAAFDGNIMLAPDNDENQAGAKGAEKIAERLRKLGFGGEIFDFTKSFMVRHPGEPYKDLNDWLKRNRGCKSIGPLEGYCT